MVWPRPRTFSALLAVTPDATASAVVWVTAAVLRLVDRPCTVVEQDGVAGAEVVARAELTGDGAGARAVVVLADWGNAHVIGQPDKGIPLVLVHRVGRQRFSPSSYSAASARRRINARTGGSVSPIFTPWSCQSLRWAPWCRERGLDRRALDSPHAGRCRPCPMRTRPKRRWLCAVIFPCTAECCARAKREKKALKTAAAAAVRCMP